MSEKTLGIIKPDGTIRNLEKHIFEAINQSGLKILKTKQIRLNKNSARQFYIEHQNKPFFDNLIEYMASGNVIIMLIDGDNAIAKWRHLIEADSKHSPSLRRKFALNKTQNTVHGSDSKNSALREIMFFFSHN
jgi:nucleoside-diphosphate kinase